MIEATVREVRDAYRALRKINEEVKLKAKAAWRVGRLMNKLKSVLTEFEQTQMKLFTDAGASPSGGGMVLQAPVRQSESDSEWSAKMERFRTESNRLNTEVNALLSERVEIDYDPIDLDLFEDAEISANDLADCGAFIKE